MGKVSKTKLKAVWGEKPVVSACEDCVNRDELKCKFAALNGLERNAVVVSCRNKIKKTAGG